MPTNTTKFNLVKPLKSEKYNVDVFNGNADIIDSQIYSKTEVDTALNGKANSVHTHPISEVTNLQTALNGKANTTTTVNNKALSSNITINASDVPNTPAGNISATNVQSALNELDTEKANRVQEAWITPTLLNGWGAEFPVAYMKDQLGFVHVKGAVRGGTIGVTVFFLPNGYRALHTRGFSTSANANFGRVVVDATGAIIIPTPSSNNIVYLDCIYFRAEA